MRVIVLLGLKEMYWAQGYVERVESWVCLRGRDEGLVYIDFS